MKLTAATAVFSLFAAVSAGKPTADMTVEEASSKCGNQAQLSCCNEVDYVGDTTTIQKGVASGILSGLLGQGSGAEGIGAFKGCSKLGVAGEYSFLSPTLGYTTLANNILQPLSVSRTSSTRSASRTLLAATTAVPRRYVQLTPGPCG